MSSERNITIPVRLDEKTFKRFARFDMFTLRKRWVRPVIFSAILIAFAFVALLTKKAQSGMIAAVLLAVGIGLPVVYFGSFFSQVNMQALQQKLKPPRNVYTMTLREEGIRAENNQRQEDALEMEWTAVQKAFRRKGCIYLYVTPTKAFLLPEGQADAPDEEVWDYLTAHMGSEKCS
ncbi:MAG: YcxB family protein [Clostridia bacterium]|nr:YcxB family protein [Clostridia bacterium]